MRKKKDKKHPRGADGQFITRVPLVKRATPKVVLPVEEAPEDAPRPDLAWDSPVLPPIVMIEPPLSETARKGATLFWLVGSIAAVLVFAWYAFA